MKISVSNYSAPDAFLLCLKRWGFRFGITTLLEMLEQEKPIDRRNRSKNSKREKNESDDNQWAMTESLSHSCSKHFALRKDINKWKVIAVRSHGCAAFRTKPAIVLLRRETVMA